MPTIIDKINQEQLKKQTASFNVGDSVRVHTIVKEGDKERIQIFTGIVIGRKGRDINATFTVRRISYGEGVERVFPTPSRPASRKFPRSRDGRYGASRQAYLPRASAPARRRWRSVKRPRAPARPKRVGFFCCHALWPAARTPTARQRLRCPHRRH